MGGKAAVRISVKRQKQKSEITIPLQPFHRTSVSSIPKIGLGIFPFCRYYISERRKGRKEFPFSWMRTSMEPGSEGKDFLI